MAKADLRMEAVALRDAVNEHRAAPPSTPQARALRQAWDAIVRPRLENLLASVEWLADAGSWVLDDEDRAIRLRPELWDAAVTQLADLYTALSGALAQYRTFRLEWRAPTRYGAVRGKPSAEGRGEKAKKAAAERKAATAKAAAKAEADLAAVAQEVAEALAAQRDALEAQLRGVQHLMARMQKAEEDRLRPDCELCFEGEPGRAARAREIFDRLRVGRLNAESFAGDPPSKYGTLLRQGWRVHHQRMLALLGDAALPPTTPTSEAAAPEAAASEAPAPKSKRPRKASPRARSAASPEGADARRRGPAPGTLPPAPPAG